MLFDRTPLAEDLRGIVEEITRIAASPYVQQYVDIPDLAENRLALLYFFLRDSGMEKERARILCVTAGLVQLGLDTHETVKAEYENTLTAERNRQLSVLAGDYYSSRYYQLLAEAGEIDALRLLADAIQVVNEAKITYYLLERDNKLSWDTYLSLRKTMDTALYTAIVDRFALTEEERRFWRSLLEETSVVERMIGEWEQLKWQQQTPFGLARFLLQRPGSSLAHVLESLEAKAMELLNACEQLVRSLYSAEKQNALAWITSRYSHRVRRLKRVAEEM